MIELDGKTDIKSVLDTDATTLAKQIQNQEISSLHATETYIKHIKSINPQLNCLVEDRYSTAIKEAKLADEQIKLGKNQGRLLGVPISMKECFDVADMKTTGGIPARKNDKRDADSAVVTRLKAEGAIILGKTNTPALCFCQETDNKLYGRTNNPWDVSKTVGGSSGGEAALIAAGGAAIGIGSDIGGSLRFPSHFNGVVGFKSGNSQISYEGGFPSVNIPLQQRMLGVGALSKSVQDAKLINEILSDTITLKKQLDSFEIIMPFRQIHYPINIKTHSLLLTIKKFLEKQFTVHDQQPPYYQASALLWQLIMAIDGAKGTADYALDNPSSTQIVKEYVKEKLFKSSPLHRYLTWSLIGANIFKPNSEQITEIEKTIIEGDHHLSAHLKDRLLILPVYHSAASEHGKVYSELFSIRKTYLQYIPFVSYANVWGLPALIIPIGEDESGMPISIQIIGLIGNEDAIFQLGTLLEEEFRGYKRCII